MNAKVLQFYKDNGNRWYVDNSNFTQEECEMVCGADTILEHMSEGRIRFSVCVEYDVNPSEADIIKLDETNDGGCNYLIKEFNGVENFNFWLCSLNAKIMGEHHDTYKIYSL